MTTLFSDFKAVDKNKTNIGKSLKYITKITTTVSDVVSKWQQLSELLGTARLLFHAIDCSFGEYEFIYLNILRINTLKILHKHLRKKSTFQISNILALFLVKKSK